MPERVPVQLRAVPDLHDRVAAAAHAYHTSRNAMYQLLIELGLNCLGNLERDAHPERRVLVSQRMLDEVPPDTVSRIKASISDALAERGASLSELAIP